MELWRATCLHCDFLAMDHGGELERFAVQKRVKREAQAHANARPAHIVVIAGGDQIVRTVEPETLY